MTLLSEDKLSDVTDISLAASGIVPMTEGVGVPRKDAIIGADIDGEETRVEGCLEGSSYDRGADSDGDDA